MSAEGEFFISVTGSIEYASFYDIDNVYCKYGYHFGQDWTVVRGIEEGLSQMSKGSCDARQLAVWNFPLDVAFKSINPQGWPQLILSIYGLDFFGHDVIRGYGVCHLPMTTGTHIKKVAVYVPQSSSILQQFVAWFSGRRPELIDPTILASGDGRERPDRITTSTLLPVGQAPESMQSALSDKHTFRIKKTSTNLILVQNCQRESCS